MCKQNKKMSLLKFGQSISLSALFTFRYATDCSDLCYWPMSCDAV
jgi:hypothetical protein